MKEDVFRPLLERQGCERPGGRGQKRDDREVAQEIGGCSISCAPRRSACGRRSRSICGVGRHDGGLDDHGRSAGAASAHGTAAPGGLDIGESMSMPEDQIAVQPVKDPILCSPYEEPELHWLYDTRTGIPSKNPRAPARELLVQERAHRQHPTVAARRGGTRRPAPRQRAARRREALAGVGLAGPRRRRRNGCCVTGGARTGRGGCSFCQVEAVETIIYLREMLARGRPPRRKPELGVKEFELLGRGVNPRPETWSAKVAQPPKLVDRAGGVNGAKPIPRYACKMATGSGKTVVMAMLVAWAFCNRGTKPGDPALPAARARGLPEPDHQGTPPRAAARRFAQLLRGVRPRAFAPAAGTGQGGRCW